MNGYLIFNIAEASISEIECPRPPVQQKDVVPPKPSTFFRRLFHPSRRPDHAKAEKSDEPETMIIAPGVVVITINDRLDIQDDDRTPPDTMSESSENMYRKEDYNG